LTDLVHENILPYQIKNAHFLPVGEPMPEGIKVLENPASCVFFVYIHESSCELVDLCFERHFSFFYQDFLFERSSFYFQFTFNFTQKRMSYAHFQQPDWFDCVSDLKVR